MASYRSLATLFVFGGLALACAEEAEPPAPERDTGTAKTRDGGTRDAQSGTSCEVPKSCEALDVPLFTYEVCCTAKIECGWDLSPVVEAYKDIIESGMGDELLPPGFDPKNPCVKKGDLFVFIPGLPEERIEVEDGDEIVISPSCKAVNWSGFQMPGCCLPDGSCGISTHINQATFNSYADDPSETFAKPECLSSAQFNASLKATTLAPTAFFPKLSGRCE